MSGPPPWTVHTLPETLWPPAGATAPMSPQLHPLGQASSGPGNSPGLTATVSSVTAPPVPCAWEVMARPASRGCGRLRASDDPGIRVQLVPSGDVKALKKVWGSVPVVVYLLTRR